MPREEWYSNAFCTCQKCSSKKRDRLLDKIKPPKLKRQQALEGSKDTVKSKRKKERYQGVFDTL